MSKTVRLSGWCQDRFTIDHEDPDYVPHDKSGIGGGDQFAITVDVETGKIIGWNPEDWKNEDE